MQIKPPFIQVDAQGLPANAYEMHIGRPNENPLNPDNKLVVYNGNGGAQVSNPFYFDAYGRPINSNGHKINPWIDEETYSYVVLSPSGGQFDAEEEVSSDRITSGDVDQSVVDATFNNLNDVTTGALYQDLSAYETVYIQSLNSGWEGSVTGPQDGFYAHKDGTTGPSSTGDENQFFDAAGNGWTRDDRQRIDEATITSIENDINGLQNTYSGYIYGINTSSSDGDTVAVTAGKCADSTGALVIDVGAQSADIKNRISAGGNLSGAASPSADTTYFLFVVSEADGTNPKLAFDTSLTATNALSEWSTETGNAYTLYRLIGFALTDGTPDIKGFNHKDDKWFYTSDYPSVNQASSTTTAVTIGGIAGNIPNIDNIRPNGTIMIDTVIAALHNIIITNFGVSPPLPTLTNSSFVLNSGEAYTVYMDAFFRFGLSDIIQFRSDSSSALNIFVKVTGWEFNR